MNALEGSCLKPRPPNTKQREAKHLLRKSELKETAEKLEKAAIMIKSTYSLRDEVSNLESQIAKLKRCVMRKMLN